MGMSAHPFLPVIHADEVNVCLCEHEKVSRDTAADYLPNELH